MLDTVLIIKLSSLKCHVQNDDTRQGSIYSSNPLDNCYHTLPDITRERANSNNHKQQHQLVLKFSAEPVSVIETGYLLHRKWQHQHTSLQNFNTQSNQIPNFSMSTLHPFQLLIFFFCRSIGMAPDNFLFAFPTRFYQLNKVHTYR